eukprot:TRINITY_DN1452_c0_g1_i1.p1 TRINITY_DN1452_c0_g1~~TRINITY_DN1452_c0_g1_i1.p1  ORF type:complete len:232 (+),score=55.67 TRINITY_DN1452_c0_g1_i1:59-754(+)
MTKVLIFGASGTLGTCLIKVGLKKSYEITAAVRNVEKMEKIAIKNGIQEDIEIVKVDIMDKDQLVPIINEHDVVISALGAPVLFKESFIISKGHENIVRAMKETENNVNTFLACSSWGSGVNFEAHDGFLYKQFITRIIKQPLLDHERSENFIKTFQEDEFNDLKFMVIRPPGLSNGPSTNLEFISVNDRYSLEIDSHRISRMDVARFFYNQLKLSESPHWNHFVAISTID